MCRDVLCERVKGTDAGFLLGFVSGRNDDSVVDTATALTDRSWIHGEGWAAALIVFAFAGEGRWRCPGCCSCRFEDVPEERIAASEEVERISLKGGVEEAHDRDGYGNDPNEENDGSDGTESDKCDDGADGAMS